MKTRKNHRHFLFFFYSIGSCERTTFSFLCTNVLEQPFSVQRLISIARHSEAGMSKQIGSWPAEYSSTGSCDLVSNTTASAFERVRRKLIESVFFWERFWELRGSNFVGLELKEL
jgi:hypothetical protein